MTREEILKTGWQIQAEKDIYYAITPWDLHSFACIMKDGTLQIFTGMCDETDEGEIIYHLDCDRDYYDGDIVYWIEIPEIK